MTGGHHVDCGLARIDWSDERFVARTTELRASPQSTMVSAWASVNRLILGQTKVDERHHGHTRTAQYDVSGCTVTIAQKDIATTIIDQGADYVLAARRTNPNSTKT